jgi:hypothetical protein
MKTFAIIMAAGVVIWWIVKPGSTIAPTIGGFIGNIIAYIQYLVGAPLIGGG